MVGTRIMVFKLKDIIKTAVIVFLGIILITVLTTFFMNDKKEEENFSFRAGTYEGLASLNVGETAVLVTVSENRVIDIAFTEESSINQMLYPALVNVRESVLRNQNLSNIQGYSEQIIAYAVNDALNSARR